MKRPEELSHMLTEMYNDTKDGKIHWNISVQTTENNEVSEKPVEVEDGVSWTIDECYVSYYCKYKGQDFLMITYEMIKTAGDKVHTTNMIFLPPLGIRVFQLPMLLPYAVQASGVLANQIHNLWELLLAMKKADPELRYEPVQAGDKTYLVNTSGTIQKSSASSTSDAKPELGKGFRDYKDSNDTVWTVDTEGIIQ